MEKGKNLSFRTRMVEFFLLIIVITTLVILYTYVSGKILMGDMTDLLNRSQELTEVFNEINITQSNLEDYLSTRGSNSLQAYYSNTTAVQNSIDILSEKYGYTERGIKITNLCNMIEHYMKIVDETIIEKKDNETDYTELYLETVKEYNYIGEYIQEILSSDLEESGEKYEEIKQSIALNRKINYAMFAITILLLTITIVTFSFDMTKPLSDLAECANEISKGNFTVEFADSNTSREMSILTQTFNLMTDSIRNYICEMETKQRLSQSLIEEKIENLKMKNALREAELLALQSQVNPHFIFNTINIGSQIAMLQGDQMTSEYLVNAAAVFRYNLKGLDNNATIKDEVDNVNAYMNLLMTRFGDIIDYKLNVLSELESFIVPRMTLQPLIENAYIHGISKFENGGIIELIIEKKEKSVVITVSNTGDEIPQEMIDKILKGKTKSSHDNNGHTTGIGIDNVLKRLRLFYNQQEVMKIVCSKGKTNFILVLPIEGKTRIWRNVSK